MKNSIKYLIIIALIAGAGALFYSKVYIPKTTYVKESVKVKDMAIEVSGIGTLDAQNIYRVSAGVNAKLLEMEFEAGEWVKKGDLLAKLDSVDMPVALSQSKISVTKSRSELTALQKELESLKAQKHLALITFERYKKLKKQSYASQSEYDKAAADLDVVEAQMKSTQAHIASARIAISIAQKSVKALEEKLARFEVYAPTDGLIIAKKAEVSTSVLAPQTLYEIVNTQDVWVKAYVDESISGEIKVGDKAEIKLRSKSSKSYSGYVKRIAPLSDAVTQEREINVAFDTLPLPFYLNEQAEVSVATRVIKDAHTIPARAIVYTKDGSGVWTVENGKAHFVKSEIIAISHGRVALTNLNKDATLLVVGTKNRPLKEGMEIR